MKSTRETKLSPPNEKSPMMVAIANQKISEITQLLRNGEILKLQDPRTAQTIQSLIAKCSETGELLDFIAALQQCELSNAAIIRLLPKQFHQFKNRDIKEEIVRYIEKQHTQEESIQLCHDALDKHHPIGYILGLVRRPEEWGKNRGVLDQVDSLLAKLNKNLAKNAAHAVEMGDTDEHTRELLKDDLVEIKVDHGILFNLNDPMAIRVTIEQVVRHEDIATLDKMIEQDPSLLLRQGREHGQTPMHLAITHDKPLVITHLLTLQSSKHIVNAPNRDGVTPFSMAVSLGNEVMAKQLLNKGADPTIPDIRGITALHKAIESDHLHMVRFLIDAGVKLTRVNNLRSESAFLTAALSGSAAMIALFLKLDEDQYNQAWLANMLPNICRSMTWTTDGKQIIEKLEAIETYYRPQDIISQIRSAFEGKCSDKLQLSIVEAIRNSPSDDGTFAQRLQNAKSWEHPLGHIMALHTSPLDMFIKTNSKAQTLLETLKPAQSSDAIMDEFVMMSNSP